MLKNHLKLGTLKRLLSLTSLVLASEPPHSAMAENEIQLMEMASCVNLAQEFSVRVDFL